MQTQLLVTAKNASILTKARSSLLWFIEIFKKTRINVWIDDTNNDPITLVARKEPYEIPIKPGEHIIYFDDPKRTKRVKMHNISMSLGLSAFFGAGGAVAGGATGAAIMAGAFANGKRAEVRDNILGCSLQDGDEIKVVVKPLFKKVKVKIVS